MEEGKGLAIRFRKSSRKVLQLRVRRGRFKRDNREEKEEDIAKVRRRRLRKNFLLFPSLSLLIQRCKWSTLPLLSTLLRFLPNLVTLRPSPLRLLHFAAFPILPLPLSIPSSPTTLPRLPLPTTPLLSLLCKPPHRLPPCLPYSASTLPLDLFLRKNSLVLSLLPSKILTSSHSTILLSYLSSLNLNPLSLLLLSQVSHPTEI